MKRIVALWITGMMCLALLAGCKSADPNHPYGQEPAPMNETSSWVTEQI